MTDAAGRVPLRVTPSRVRVLHRHETAGWIMIGAMALAAALLMASRGLSFDWPSARTPFVACVALMAGVAVYRNWRSDERIATSLAAVALLIAFSAVGEIFSYAVTSVGGPLWDTTFETWDKAMGLDWRAYLSAVEAHPRLAAIFGIAYDSLVIQIIVAAALLGLCGRLAECRTFAHAVAFAGLLTIVVSGVTPANSMFVHLGLRAADYAHIDSTGAFAPLAPFNGLRAGVLRTISLDRAEGIIAFPSFHAALGVVFIFAFWSLRWLRWPAIALNVVLLASTPLNGGHYFVDVLAGIVVAAIAVAAARWLNERARPATSANLSAFASLSAFEARPSAAQSGLDLRQSRATVSFLPR